MREASRVESKEKKGSGRILIWKGAAVFGAITVPLLTYCFCAVYDINWKGPTIASTDSTVLLNSTAKALMFDQLRDGLEKEVKGT